MARKKLVSLEQTKSHVVTMAVNYSKKRKVRATILRAIDTDTVFMVAQELRQFVSDLKANQWIEDVQQTAKDFSQKAAVFTRSSAPRGNDKEADLCTRCGSPIDHNEPHTECSECRSR